jgi:hypothetical protein
MISRTKNRRVLFVPLAVILLAAAWLLLRPHQTEDQVAAEKARASFIETCKKQGRLANGGGQLSMDDATEESLDQYCSCVADHFDQALSAEEITAIGAGTASQETVAKLGGVVITCQAQHLLPKDGSAPSSAPAN